MKKTALIAALTMVASLVSAQTMNIFKGSVGYAFNPSQATECTYSDGALNVAGHAFTINDITKVIIEESNFEDNCVNINYNGDEAKVIIAGNLIDQVEATVQGAHVTLLAKPTLDAEVTYTLSGKTTNGSLYMGGDFKSMFVFNGVDITNPDSAAVNIQNGKRIAVNLVKGTTNTLADGINGVNDDSDAHKACFYVDGHAEFEGGGSLTITGNVKHAYCSDEYTQIKKSTGNFTIANAAGDGMHIGQYLLVQGGIINITSEGDGIDVGMKKDPETENNGLTTIEAGHITIVANGGASKGIKSEGDIVITDGSIDITVNGDAVYDAEKADLSSPAAIKGDATFTMDGGELTVLATGDGGKALNCDGDITFNGGKFTGATVGDTYVHSATLDTKPQGIKSDQNITINGGEVYIAASEDSGNAFKTDHFIYFNGGTVMGIGKKMGTPATSSLQNSKTYSNVNVTKGATVSYDGVSFTVPELYSNSSAKIIVSSPDL